MLNLCLKLWGAYEQKTGEFRMPFTLPELAALRAHTRTAAFPKPFKLMSLL